MVFEVIQELAANLSGAGHDFFVVSLKNNAAAQQRPRGTNSGLAVVAWSLGAVQQGPRFCAHFARQSAGVRAIGFSSAGSRAAPSRGAVRSRDVGGAEVLPTVSQPDRCRSGAPVFELFAVRRCWALTSFATNGVVSGRANIEPGDLLCRQSLCFGQSVVPATFCFGRSGQPGQQRRAALPFCATVLCNRAAAHGSTERRHRTKTRDGNTKLNHRDRQP